MIVKFNISFDTGCLEFKFLDNKIASCFSKLSNFDEKSYITLIRWKSSAFYKVVYGDVFRCGGKVF